MEKKLKDLKRNFLRDIEEAKDSQLLSNLKNKYLGRKGELTNVLKEVKNLTVAEKPKVGKLANEIKNELADIFDKTEKIIKNKEIHQLLRFYKPWEREAINIMKFENKGNKTNITWIMEGSLDYPIGRFMKVKLEDQIGKDFEHGLIKLRKYCYNNIN